MIRQSIGDESDCQRRLLKELDTRVENRYLIINRVRERLSPAVEKQIAQEGLELLFVLYDDDEIRRLDSEGKPIYDISKKSKVYDSFDAVLSGCFKLNV